jgi:hypothetical protein
MKTMYTSLLVVNRAKWMLMGLVLAVVLLFPHQDATAGQMPVNLRSADSFAVLAGTAITSLGATTINGDVGVWPGNGFTPGVPAVIVNGTKHLGDSIAAQAQGDLTSAYNDAKGRTTGAKSPGQELAGLTLTPGLYKSASGVFHITSGKLWLDAKGDPNAVWIFQMGSELVVGTGCQVILAGGAQARNIFWQVGSSATLETTSVFKGNILAYTAIWVKTGATLDGRALARGAEVTLEVNTLTKQPKPKFIDQPWRILLMN